MNRRHFGRSNDKFAKWGDTKANFKSFQLLGEIAATYIRENHSLYATNGPLNRYGKGSLSTGSSTDHLTNPEVPRIISRRGRPRKDEQEENGPRVTRKRYAEEVEPVFDETTRSRRNVGPPKHFDNMVMMETKRTKRDITRKDNEDEDNVYLDDGQTGADLDGENASKATRKRDRNGRSTSSADATALLNNLASNNPLNSHLPYTHPHSGTNIYPGGVHLHYASATDAASKRAGFQQFLEQLREFFSMVGAWYGVSGPIILHYLREQILPVLRVLSANHLPKETANTLIYQISRSISSPPISVLFLKLIAVGRGFPLYCAIVHTVKQYDPDNLYGMKSMHYFVEPPPMEVFDIYLRKVVESLDGGPEGNEKFRQVARLMEEVLAQWKNYDCTLENRLEKIAQIDRLLPENVRGLRARLYHVLMLPTTIMSRTLQQQQDLDEAHVLSNAAHMMGEEFALVLSRIGSESLRDTGIVFSGIQNTVLFNNVAFTKPNPVATAHPAMAAFEYEIRNQRAYAHNLGNNSSNNAGMRPGGPVSMYLGMNGSGGAHGGGMNGAGANSGIGGGVNGGVVGANNFGMRNVYGGVSSGAAMGPRGMSSSGGIGVPGPFVQSNVAATLAGQTSALAGSSSNTNTNSTAASSVTATAGSGASSTNGAGPSVNSASENTRKFLADAERKVPDQYKQPFTDAMRKLFRSFREKNTPQEEIDARVLLVQSFVPLEETEFRADIVRLVQNIPGSRAAVGGGPTAASSGSKPVGASAVVSSSNGVSSASGVYAGVNIAGVQASTGARPAPVSHAEKALYDVIELDDEEEEVEQEDEPGSVEEGEGVGSDGDDNSEHYSSSNSSAYNSAQSGNNSVDGAEDVQEMDSEGEGGDGEYEPVPEESWTNISTIDTNTSLPIVYSSGRVGDTLPVNRHNAVQDGTESDGDGSSSDSNADETAGEDDEEEEVENTVDKQVLFGREVQGDQSVVDLTGGATHSSAAAVDSTITPQLLLLSQLSNRVPKLSDADNLHFVYPSNTPPLSTPLSVEQDHRHFGNFVTSAQPLVFPHVVPFLYPPSCTPFSDKFHPKHRKDATSSSAGTSVSGDGAVPGYSTLLNRAMFTAGKVKDGEERPVQMQKAMAFYFDTNYPNYEMTIGLLADTFRVSFQKLKSVMKKEVDGRIGLWSNQLCFALQHALKFFHNDLLPVQRGVNKLRLCAEKSGVNFLHLLLWYAKHRLDPNPIPSVASQRASEQDQRFKMDEMLTLYFRMQQDGFEESRGALATKYHMSPVAFSQRLLTLSTEEVQHYCHAATQLSVATVEVLSRGVYDPATARSSSGAGSVHGQIGGVGSGVVFNSSASNSTSSNFAGHTMHSIPSTASSVVRTSTTSSSGDTGTTPRGRGRPRKQI